MEKGAEREREKPSGQTKRTNKFFILKERLKVKERKKKDIAFAK